MPGFDKFQNAMIEAAKSSILPVVELHKDSFAEVLKNDIFELDGPRQFERKASEKELYFGKIFRGFNEVSASLQTLEEIAFYIGRFPFRQEKITPERYLQFHVEAYYSEIYILRERVKKYLKLLERQYKSDSRIPLIKKNCGVLSNLLEQSLGSLIDLRGRHVHEVRFSDDGINRLVTLALLCSTKKEGDEFSKLVEGYYLEKYREVKKSWKHKAKRNNKNIRELLDFFFDTLYPLIFDDKTGVFVYPSRLQS